ncbi:MAG TPA: hypothetical protein PLI98_12715, partial [Candidatus Hydrogenedentes bacterium]|nr:hypothetical protein [Candidatus Hydrogenedentota bacterium]
MPHTHRFYCPGLAATAPGTEFPLPKEEARHAVAVLRLRPGDRLEVFDGLGLSGSGTFVRGDRSGAVVSLEHLARREPPSIGVYLAPAWPHRD